jgi:hypothetical protein
VSNAGRDSKLEERVAKCRNFGWMARAKLMTGCREKLVPLGSYRDATDKRYVLVVSVMAQFVI